MRASRKGAVLKPAKRWQGPVVCLALAAITFAVFLQTGSFQFIEFDDNGYIYENPVVQKGLTFQGFAWAFSFHDDNWHPLTWFSHMLDCQLYGLESGRHHLTNVILHAATVIALFLVLRQLTGALWRSAFVAAVFAIHPLRAESVAWVAERKDVLSGFFFMLTVGSYARYVHRNRAVGPLVLAVVFFAFGLMAKPMLVTLPFVLLLLDFWPLRRKESPRRLLLEKWPFFALSAAACVTTILAQSKAIQPTWGFPLPLRLANAALACVIYLRQMLWPSGLALFYPHLFSIPIWQTALALTLLAGLTTVAFWQRRAQPWLLAGWLWYLVMLVPVLGIIQVGGQAHADRYTYLPQIGLDVALTWLAARWLTQRGLAAVVMVGIIAALMVCAWKQTAYWKDGETLWTRSLACTTNNEVAHYGLGNALSREGELDAAIAEYQQALQIKADLPEVENNLGFALSAKGDWDAAITQLQKAVDREPRYARAHYNLGTALLNKGRVDDAIAHLQKAAELEPGFAETYNNLGSALLQKGRVADAIVQFQKALQANPNNVSAYDNLGNALFQEGKPAEAARQYEQALRLRPSNPQVLNNLAWLLATTSDGSLRDGRKALELTRRAEALTGADNPILLHTLGAALAETGQFADAISTAQKAIDLARSAGQTYLVKQLNSDLKRYEAGMPIRPP